MTRHRSGDLFHPIRESPAKFRQRKQNRIIKILSYNEET